MLGSQPWVACNLIAEYALYKIGLQALGGVVTWQTNSAAISSRHMLPTRCEDNKLQRIKVIACKVSAKDDRTWRWIQQGLADINACVSNAVNTSSHLLCKARAAKRLSKISSPIPQCKVHWQLSWKELKTKLLKSNNRGDSLPTNCQVFPDLPAKRCVVWSARAPDIKKPGTLIAYTCVCENGLSSSLAGNKWVR